MTWGGDYTNKRGKQNEKVFEICNLFLLNKGSKTRFNAFNGKSTAIDLCLCDPSVAADLKWEVMESLNGSDHY